MGSDPQLASELHDVCVSFETALEEFGRLCFHLQANEAAFQAWYAACVMKEIDLSRVYREIIVRKDDLETHATRHLAALVKSKGELKADLAVSWDPKLDARHYCTRDPGLRAAGNMLRELAILTEFKVSASVSQDRGWGPLKEDLAKLGLFASAAAAAGSRRSGLATYMVQLDNRRQPEARQRDWGDYPHEWLGGEETELEKLRALWPENVVLPTLVVLREDGAYFYRDLTWPGDRGLARQTRTKYQAGADTDVPAANSNG